MLEGNLAGNYHSLADAISQTPASPGIMNASNLTLFLQPATGLEQLKTLIDKRYTERLDAWSRYNAQVTFLQFSSLEDRLYAHLSVYGDSLEISPLVPRHKEVRMQDGTRQDTLARGTPPYKVFNHLTRKGNELFQTPWPECRLIMRDHTGKTLWEKTMEGPIQDRVAQLDFLKNDKLQMLFSIGNRLYLLDRLGRNVSPIPGLMQPVFFMVRLYLIRKGKRNIGSCLYIRTMSCVVMTSLAVCPAGGTIFPFPDTLPDNPGT